MLDPHDYFKFVIALYALLNPLGSVPVFLTLTADMRPEVRRATARTAAFSMFVILAVALFFGELILAFFGISIHSFRVGGGILILMMALSMMHARQSPSKQTPEESEEASTRESIGVVPLAMPILAGPGSISAVILFAHRADGWMHYATVVLILALLSLLLYPILRFSTGIARRFGQTGINITTRVMGLILAAIAVEFIASGLRGLFPELATL